MVTVFADINCPFCYALNEWLADLEIDDQIDWRLINHNPKASFTSQGERELMELTNEVYTVRHRAPMVPIAIPIGRANALNASKYIYAVKASHPEKASNFRRKIYQAYWVYGENIESEEVLKAIATDLGIKPPDIDDLDLERQLKESTQNWRSGPYENRIPSMHRDSEKPFCGLPSKPACINYVLGKASDGTQEDSDSCIY